MHVELWWCFILNAIDSDPVIDDDETSDANSHVIVPDVGDLPAMEHETLSFYKIQEIVNDVKRRMFASIYSW